MTRHFCLILGRVKIENWRVYIERLHHNKSGQCRWRMWDRLI